MAIVSVAEVQRWLRDYPEYNILLDAVEFSEDDVEAALDFAVSEFNAHTPITAYDGDSFPNRWILLLGTARHLLTSEAFHQLRNEVHVQDGSLPVGIDDKASAYISLRNALTNEWRSIVKDMKQQINMESGYGGVSSGYRYIRSGTRYP